MCIEEKLNNVLHGTYDDVEELDDEYLIYWKDGRVGLLNARTGEVIVSASFRRIHKFHDVVYGVGGNAGGKTAFKLNCQTRVISWKK